MFCCCGEKMFCTKCGKQLPDDCAFCGQCGTPVEKAPAQPIAQSPVEEKPAEEVRPEAVAPEEAPVETPVVETPVAAAEEPVAETPAQEPAFAQFEAPKLPQKSKKKLIGWLSAAAAVVVAGAVAVGAFWKPIQGAIVENFGSEQDYLSYVEQNSTQKLTDTLSSAYGSVAEALSAGPASGAYNVNMKLTVGDKLISMVEDMLEDQAGEKIDLDWLSSVDLDMNVNAKDSLQQIGMALNLGETELAKLDMILNMDKGEVFLGVLSLSDKYLKGELDMTAAMPNEVLDLLSSEELQKALPSEKEMDALLDKYIGIVFDNLKDVEKSSKTIKIAGVSQKLTALETEIDQDDVVSVATALLKAAKDDKQIEKIISNAAKFMEDNDLIEDADDAYDIFKEGIEEALEAAEDAELDGDFEIVLTDYVNDSHEVVGRRIEVNGQQILYYAEVHNGSKMAFELETAVFQIYGDGTEKNGVVNAEYTLWLRDAEVCTVTLVDFRAEGENLNGKIRFAPSADLLKNMGLDSMGASAISLADPQLELGFENTKSSSKIEVNLLSGNDTLIGIALTGKETKSNKITLPDNKDVYDQDEAEEWLQELDAEKLLEKIEDATGLPLSDLMQGGVSQEVQKPVTPGGNSSNVSGGNSSNISGGNSSSAVDSTRPAVPEPSGSATEATENTEPEDYPAIVYPTLPEEEVIYPTISDVEIIPTLPEEEVTYPTISDVEIVPTFPEEEVIYPTISDIEVVPTLPATEEDVPDETFPFGTGTVITPDSSGTVILPDGSTIVIPILPSTGGDTVFETYPVISGTVITPNDSVLKEFSTAVGSKK